MKNTNLFNKGLFTDDNGKTSTVRVASLLTVITALFIAVYQVVITEAHTFDVTQVVTLLTFGMGSKVGQKYIELSKTK